MRCSQTVSSFRFSCGSVSLCIAQGLYCSCPWAWFHLLVHDCSCLWFLNKRLCSRSQGLGSCACMNLKLGFTPLCIWVHTHEQVWSKHEQGITVHKVTMIVDLNKNETWYDSAPKPWNIFRKCGYVYINYNHSYHSPNHKYIGSNILDKRQIFQKSKVENEKVKGQNDFGCFQNKWMWSKATTCSNYKQQGWNFVKFVPVVCPPSVDTKLEIVRLPFRHLYLFH